MDFDKERIINGTPRKKLSKAFNELKGNYSKTKAREYYLLCKEYTASDILDCADLIYPEPYKGAMLVRDTIMESCCSLQQLDNITDNFNEYFDTMPNKLSMDQKMIYDEVKTDLNNKRDSFKHSLNIVRNSECLDNHKLDCLVNDYIHDKEIPVEDIRREIYQFDDSAGGMTNKLHSLLQLGDEGYLIEWISSNYIKNPDTEFEIQRNITISGVLSRAMRDQGMLELINKLSDRTGNYIRSIAGSQSYDKISKKITTFKVSPNTDYLSPEDGLSELLDDDLNNREDDIQDGIDIKLDILNKRKAAVDTEAEFLFYDTLDDIEEDPVTESYSDVMDQFLMLEFGEVPEGDTFLEKRLNGLIDLSSRLSDEIEICEWTKDGTPNIIISKEIGDHVDFDERMRQEKEKDYKKKQERKKALEEGKKERDMMFDNDTEEPSDDDIDSIKFEFGLPGSQEREIERSRRKGVKLEEKRQKQMIKAKTTATKQAVKDNNKATKATIKANKPKPGIVRGAQNVAAKVNMKATQVGAAAKKVGDEVGAVVKTVTKVPSNIMSSIKGKINEWDDMDDNKRKAYIVKPGSRKVYYKLLRMAATHGVAFAINPLLNIIVFAAQYIGSKKDKRMTNELISELTTEIQVTEEKIQDANSKGDNDKKYRLIRIKDKLNAELIRVQSNSKLI